ncbi:MAG TPA: DUF4389 domain-containing protein [Solirubrobacteraceae bacterium]|nr:DUF4389 domain-containing protein [Solirubrobacteraceae bacterium]
MRPPIRLTVADDLRRGHGSVFFRAWLALPLLLWLAIWTVAAIYVAFAAWVTTLMLGRTPEMPHHFLARYVRYATHVYAYFNLAAEPLPRFDGKPGYPIDVEIDPPADQNRWSVGFRLILAIPAALLTVVLVGLGASAFSAAAPSSSISLLAVAAILGWFVAVARGRMPRGLRDLALYSLSCGAQFWAYLLLLTDRYPSIDPLTAIGPLPVRADPLRVEVTDLPRRSRVTVFFRLPLAVPHFVWLALWGILALLAAVLNWLWTLITGTPARGLRRFLLAYMRYQLHVNAFAYLIANPFPGFTGAAGSYPIELHATERERQNRWSVLARAPLALPALLIASAYGSLLLVVAILGWFAALATGSMPLGFRNAGALALRYSAQTWGYLIAVTGAYPYSGPCLESPPAG